MILLISRRDDGSTRQVAEWLYAMQKTFLRLNGEESKNCISGCCIASSTFRLQLNDKSYTLSLKRLKSVWNRRNGFSNSYRMAKSEKLAGLFHEGSSYAEKHCTEEVGDLVEYFYYCIESHPSVHKIGHQSHNRVNKLVVLKTARICGLKVPGFFIISTKKELKDLMKAEGNLVTKAIGNGVYRFTDQFGYYSYTERINNKFVNQLPQTFLPSMVQKQLDKLYELRIFYLEEKFYAMAIFSQESAATEVDNRKNFAAECMPRRVPYLLPQNIKSQLKKLMKKLHLNTGSIDMVVTPDKEYIFLEVNPVGQFGMVSQPCNYYLEKKLAETL